MTFYPLNAQSGRSAQPQRLKLAKGRFDSLCSLTVAKQWPERRSVRTMSEAPQSRVEWWVVQESNL